MAQVGAATTPALPLVTAPVAGDAAPSSELPPEPMPMPVQPVATAGVPGVVTPVAAAGATSVTGGGAAVSAPCACASVGAAAVTPTSAAPQPAQVVQQTPVQQAPVQQQAPEPEEREPRQPTQQRTERPGRARERRPASEGREQARAQSERPAQSRQATTSRSFARTATPAAIDANLPRGNERSVDEAIAWARSQASDETQDWYRRCLNMMAQAYGWDASGVPYAIDHFTAVPESMRHTDRNPPEGALVYWTTGSRAGHVALSMGDGMVASNDIRGNGDVAIVPMSEIESTWGADYVGWTPPYFPQAAG